MTRHRRGGAYLMVLGSAMVLMTLALAGLTVVRVQEAAAKLEDDAAGALLQARSAIERGVESLDDSIDARKTFEGVPVINGERFGGGAHTLWFTDPDDGDLSDAEGDAIELHAIGTQGQARQMLRMIVEPRRSAVSALSPALAVGGSLSFSSAWVSSVDQVHANGFVTATGSQIDAPVSSTLTVTGLSFLQPTRGAVTSVSFPDGYALLAAYRGLGPSVSLSVIANARIERALIAPGGSSVALPPSALGVWVIECAGADIVIRDSRIVGTLVLVDPGKNSRLEGSLAWEPAQPDLPALVVIGDLVAQLSGQDLSESSAARNFNPNGAPYRGVTNTTSVDAYPAVIEGAVFVSGGFTSMGALAVDGPLMIVGQASISGGPVMLRRGVVPTPLGFDRVSGWTMRPGSYRRVVDED